MMWNPHLIKGLEEILLLHSIVDEYVSYWRESIFIVYVDHSIFEYPSNSGTEQVITDIGAKFYIEYQVNPNNDMASTLSTSLTGKSIFRNLSWLYKLCWTWTLRKGSRHNQRQTIPGWSSDNTFQRLPSTIGSNTFLLLENSTSSIRAREETFTMQLTKSRASARTIMERTAPPSKTLLDTSTEPEITGWFWIITVPSPSNCMLTKPSVRTDTGRPQVMTPGPKNRNQGIY